MVSSSNTRLGDAPEEGIKAPVIVESVGTLTLFGEQTVNTVAVVDNDRVLYKDATLAKDNGIYIVKLGKNWVRASDFNEASDVINGVMVLSVHTSILYQVVVSGFWTVNVTPVNFTVLLAAGSSGVWGTIVGTLSNQTDLQAALDAKVDDSQVLTNVPAGAVFTDTLYTHPNHTGDVTSAGDGAQTITNNAVTFAKMVDITQDTVIGRVSAGSGDPEALTQIQFTGLVNQFTSALSGAVSGSGGGTTNFLRADGSWIEPPTNLVTSVFGRQGVVTALQADYDGFFLTPAEGDAAYSALGHAHTLADITDSGALAALATVGIAEIDDEAVTLAKIQHINQDRFLGRVLSGAGDVEELTGTQATTILDNFTDALKGLAPLSGGGTANFLRADGTWTVPAGSGGNVSNTGTPVDDQVAVWTAAAVIEGTTGLTYNGSVLNVAGDVDVSGKLVIGTDNWQLNPSSSTSIIIQSGSATTNDLVFNGSAGAALGTLSFGNGAVDRIELRHGNGTIVWRSQEAGSLKLYHNSIEKLQTTSAGIDVTGNITLTGTVDGRDVDADGTKLDTIETNAKDDQTAGEIEAIVSHDNLVAFISGEHFLQAAISITLSQVSDSGALAALATVGSSEIDNGAVTFAKMQNIPTANILGRVTAATGVVEDLTSTQATTLINTFTTSLKGLAPSSGGGTTNFLRADGTWVAPPGGGNVSNTGTPLNDQIAVWTDATTIEGTTGLTFDGSDLDVAGAITLNSGGFAGIISNPTDRIFNWRSGDAAESAMRFQNSSGTPYGHIYGSATVFGIYSSGLVAAANVDSSGVFSIFHSGSGRLFTTADGITFQQESLFSDHARMGLLADLIFLEKSDHTSTPIGGEGYLWVRQDTPNILVFTDDAGTDFDLNVIAGGGPFLLDVTDTFTGILTINDDLFLEGTIPVLAIRETGAATDQKRWTTAWSGETRYERVLDDSGAQMYVWQQVERSGTGASIQVDTIDFTAVTDITLNSAVITSGRITILETDDVDLSGVSGGLIVGGDGTGTHMAFDANEIQAKSNATTAATLVIQGAGGDTTFGAGLHVFTGPLSAQGAFTSLGIDDNASGERLQLSDTGMLMGNGNFFIGNRANNNFMQYLGGNAGAVGGGMLVYGGAHVSQASDVSLRANTNNFLYWDESDGELEIFTGSGSKTSALTIDASQRMNFEGYSEDADSYTVTVGTKTLDTTLATYFYAVSAMTAVALTFAFTNPIGTGRVTSIMVEMNNAAGLTGGAPTWPSSVDWGGNGTEPTWTSGIDVVAFWTRDGGTIWHGSAATLDSA